MPACALPKSGDQLVQWSCPHQVFKPLRSARREGKLTGVGVDANFFGKLDVRRVGTPGGTPTLSGNLAVTVPADSNPLSAGVTVAGSLKPLDSNDSRLTSTSIRNGILFAADAIGFDDESFARELAIRSCCSANRARVFL